MITRLESYVNPFTRRLPAVAAGSSQGEPVVINCQGNSFIVSDVVGGDGSPFEVSMDDGGWFGWNLGLKFKTKAGEPFMKLSFRNLQAVPITIKLYITNGEIEDARLNIVRDPNHFQVIQMFPAPSYAARPMPATLDDDPTADANLLALPGILVYDVWPCYPAAGWLYMLPEGVLRAQRKTLRIESDAALNLRWWNGVEANMGDGAIVASVPLPGSSIPFYEETSQDLVLENAGAALANILILALYDTPVWYSAESAEP